VLTKTGGEESREWFGNSASGSDNCCQSREKKEYYGWMNTSLDWLECTGSELDVLSLPFPPLFHPSFHSSFLSFFPLFILSFICGATGVILLQPYLDYGESVRYQRRHCLPNKRKIRRRKVNRVNSALPPAQPADTLALRALLLRPDSVLSVSAFYTGTFLPTSAVRRNSRIASLHLSSANGSAIFHLRFPRFVSFSAFAHIALC